MCSSSPSVPKAPAPARLPDERDAEAIAKREALERQKRTNLYGRPSTILAPLQGRRSLLGGPATTKPMGA